MKVVSDSRDSCYRGLRVECSSVGAAQTARTSAFAHFQEKATRIILVLPIRGLSDVGGMVSDTMLRKNVNERRTVTSVEKKENIDTVD